MGEPAQEVKEVQASLEGLGQFFEPVQEVIQEVIQDRSRSKVEEVQDQIQGKPVMVSLSQAAEISGQARRYLLSLIHKGKLQAVKDDKGAWLVSLEQIQDRSRSRVEVVQDQGVEGVQDQIQGRAFVNVEGLLKQLQDATFRNGWLEGQLASASEQIKLLPDLQAQALKASVQETRVRELEAELERIKAYWWYRFWSWIKGGRNV